MSAGELENEWAGFPGKMIRERYKKAAEVSRVRGVLSCLLINDIDAGIGHFENTQITVNNQVVVGTLMNVGRAFLLSFSSLSLPFFLSFFLTFFLLPLSVCWHTCPRQKLNK
jgi:hypothetical protein